MVNAILGLLAHGSFDNLPLHPFLCLLLSYGNCLVKVLHGKNTEQVSSC